MAAGFVGSVRRGVRVMPWEENFQAVCEECEWKSIPQKFKAASQADVSRHADNDDCTKAEVVEV